MNSQYSLWNVCKLFVICDVKENVLDPGSEGVISKVADLYSPYFMVNLPDSELLRNLDEAEHYPTIKIMTRKLFIYKILFLHQMTVFWKYKKECKILKFMKYSIKYLLSKTDYFFQLI